ncbi:MAG: hypothetical protein ACJAR1_000352 [Rubritalea sp.]
MQKELSHRRFVVIFGARGSSFPEPLYQRGVFFGCGCSYFIILSVSLFYEPFVSGASATYSGFAETSDAP